MKTFKKGDKVVWYRGGKKELVKRVIVVSGEDSSLPGYILVQKDRRVCVLAKIVNIKGE